MTTITGGPAHASTNDLELSWSFAFTPGAGMTVHYELKNLATTDLYVLDRLWQMGAPGPTKIDPDMVYRFERSGSLRLLLGEAPLPHSSATFSNTPHATLLPPGGVRRHTLAVMAPIKEHTAYFNCADPSGQESRSVDRINLMVQYVLGGPGFKAHEAQEDPTAIDIDENAGVMAKAKMLVSELPCPGLQVLRCKDDNFTRATLPGEAPEPFYQKPPKSTP